MKKKMIAIICTAVMALALAACGGKNTGTGTDSTAKPESTPAAEADSAASVVDSTAEEEGLDLASLDYSNPEVVVELDDAAGMEALAKDMNNRSIAAGTIVKITGAASTTLQTSLMAKRDDGSSIGVALTVEGEWETPKNGTLLEAVGVIVEGQYCNEFHVLPENIIPVE